MPGWFHRLAPPPHWRVPVSIALGGLTGLTCFVIYISRAASYMSDAPETCMNCHIMAPQYATWSHSSHREQATCNDCHVPQDSVFRKYAFKAKDGMRHSTIFTLRAEPQVIRILDEGKHVVQENCVRCHSHLLTDSKVLAYTDKFHSFRSERQCWDCHRETPHGRVNSLSSVPNARVPTLSSPVPAWLDELMSRKSKPQEDRHGNNQ